MNIIETRFYQTGPEATDTYKVNFTDTGIEIHDNFGTTTERYSEWLTGWLAEWYPEVAADLKADPIN